MYAEKESKALSQHRRTLMEKALAIAAGKGYLNVTRDELARETGLAAGTVSAAVGTMVNLRRDIVRHAIRENILAIIADALAARDPHAAKATPEQKAAALQLLAQ